MKKFANCKLHARSCECGRVCSVCVKITRTHTTYAHTRALKSSLRTNCAVFLYFCLHINYGCQTTYIFGGEATDDLQPKAKPARPCLREFAGHAAVKGEPIYTIS